MDFDRLDKLLKERKLSRRRLALECDILPGTMSTAFSRRSGLSAENCLRIAQFLNVDPDYLLGNVEEEGSYFTRLQDTAEKDDLPTAEASERVIMQGIAKHQINIALSKLNRTGCEEATKRVEELTEIPRYTEPEE